MNAVIKTVFAQTGFSDAFADVYKKKPTEKEEAKKNYDAFAADT